MSSKPGWEETDSDTDWDLNWADVGWIRDYFDHMQFDDQQRVNHFRNHYELTRKDLLVKNLKRMKRHLERSDSPEEVKRKREDRRRNAPFTPPMMAPNTSHEPLRPFLS